MFDLTGKHAFITGGASGIGLAIAKRMLQPGFQQSIRRLRYLRRFGRYLCVKLKGTVYVNHPAPILVGGPLSSGLRHLIDSLQAASEAAASGS